MQMPGSATLRSRRLYVEIIVIIKLTLFASREICQESKETVEETFSVSNILYFNLIVLALHRGAFS